MNTRYPKYKDSSVEWLGQVPEHWDVKRLKFIGDCRDGVSFPHDAQGNTTAELAFYKVGSLGRSDPNGYLQEPENRISLATAKNLGAHIFDINSIVFARVGAALLLNRFRLLKSRACLDNNMMGFQLTHSKGEVPYLWYSLSLLDMAEIVNPGAIPSVNEKQINECCTPFPPLEEQRAIAAYLDRETARLDTLLAKQKRLIEVSLEKRRALIGHAVTRGLDETMPLKDSGVDWLGQVPEHWKITRIKHELQSLNTRRVPLNSEERNLMVERAYDYYGASGIIDRVENYIFDDTLILLAQDGANLLTRKLPLAIVASGKFWVNNHAHILKPRNGNVKYFAHLLESIDYTSFVTGSAQPKLTQEALSAVRIPLPPTDEQHKIVEYLDHETAKIDILITKVRLATDLMKEHRRALIAAAVTGQIDVRAV